MAAEGETILSQYRYISSLDEAHRVSLVQQLGTKKLFLKKEMTDYHFGVIDWLQQLPIRNTPHIYEMEEHEGQLTLIEDYFPGSTLEEILDKGTKFSPAAIRDIMEQLCDILSDLHASAPTIIHRSVCPANILVTPDGTVKLLEMNSCRWFLGRPDVDSALIGKKDYTAPEQYTAGESGVLSDIYAVGMVIKRLLKEPVNPNDPDRIFVENVAWKCTQIDPKYRYQSARAVAETLRAGKDVEQSVPSPARRFLPPGYRSSSPLNQLLFTALYIIVFNVALTLNVPAASTSHVWVFRILALVFFLVLVFFSADYLDCQRYLGLHKVKSKGLRWALILLIDLILAGIFACLLMRLIP